MVFSHILALSKINYDKQLKHITTDLYEWRWDIWEERVVVSSSPLQVGEFPDESFPFSNEVLVLGSQLFNVLLSPAQMVENIF